MEKNALSAKAGLMNMDCALVALLGEIRYEHTNKTRTL